MNWVQVNQTVNDYRFDPMKISCIFRLSDITDWWLQHEEMYSTYSDLPNVAQDIFCIQPHAVGVEARFSPG
jgi:hypothetical protein